MIKPILLDDTTPYSESELRANLHMIKLFLIRQLESIYAIEEIPKLDAYCVEKAFEEMREEGYEDDGLFDDMKLFFQPLTVTENELNINPTVLSKLKEQDHNEKKNCEDEIIRLNKELDKKTRELKTLNDQLEETKEKHRRKYEETQNYDKETKVNSSNTN